jgi:hypothetical protein
LLADLLFVAACDRDAEANRLATELAALSESVRKALEAAPDEAGIAYADALVTAQADPLHVRWSELERAKLSPAARGALREACGRIGFGARVGGDYVREAVVLRGSTERSRQLEHVAALSERVRALEGRLEAICR